MGVFLIEHKRYNVQSHDTILIFVFMTSKTLLTPVNFKTSPTIFLQGSISEQVFIIKITCASSRYQHKCVFFHSKSQISIVLKSAEKLSDH